MFKNEYGVKILINFNYNYMFLKIFNYDFVKFFLDFGAGVNDLYLKYYIKEDKSSILGDKNRIIEQLKINYFNKSM